MSFPLEVFDKEISNNFIELASQYSIPVNYIGSTAIFAIAALAGNMYTNEINSKNIVYSVLVGNSGLGKSPAYNLLCGDIVSDLEKQSFEEYQLKSKEWNEAREASRVNKSSHHEPKPIRKIRMAQGGTMEGIMQNAMHSLAGFGLYYDEGSKMMGSPNAYKKDNSSTDFWNEIWNGNAYNDLRADADRERFIGKTSISVLCGMQSDRIMNYFTPESIASGLPQRFLITYSDYIPINEDIDHFALKRVACDKWIKLITNLFHMGFGFKEKITIPFTEGAKKLFNELAKKQAQKTNNNRASMVDGDHSPLMVAYDSKLFAYLGRFCSILAISKNLKKPLITDIEVMHAEMLYEFYRNQAELVFSSIAQEHNSGLNKNEMMLLENLPNKFTSEQAIEVCQDNKLSSSYFHNAFRRKFSKMQIVKKVNDFYIKL